MANTHSLCCKGHISTGRSFSLIASESGLRKNSNIHSRRKALPSHSREMNICKPFFRTPPITSSLRIQHRQTFSFLFSPIFLLSCLLVLLFCRNIGFGKKYARGDENSEVKIRAFTGSQGHFRARAGSVVRLFINLLVFVGDIFFLVAALQGCFDRSSTVCGRGRRI